jgi:hypothetical protein
MIPKAISAITRRPTKPPTRPGSSPAFDPEELEELEELEDVPKDLLIQTGTGQTPH